MSQFLIVRAAWLKASIPKSRVRRGSAGSPFLDVECQIDHISSYVDAVASGLINRKHWKFGAIASELLNDLDQVRAQLIVIDDAEKDIENYSRYLDLTRDLLESLAKVVETPTESE